MSTLKIDLHTHTKYSIEPLFLVWLQLRARHTPGQLIEAARKKGLNGLAITDHECMYGAKLGEKYIKKKGIEDFTLIKGEEINTSSGHIIGLGIEEPIKSHLDVQETADKIKEQGGFVVVPHAYNKLGIKDKVKDINNVDAIEIFNLYNPLSSLRDQSMKRYADIAKKRNLACVIGSDAHVLSDVGKVYNEVKCEHGANNVLKAIQKYHSVCVNKTNILDTVKTIAKTLSLSAFSFRKHPVFD